MMKSNQLVRLLSRGDDICRLLSGGRKSRESLKITKEILAKRGLISCLVYYLN